jgi:hypothetical protein
MQAIKRRDSFVKGKEESVKIGLGIMGKLMAKQLLKA